MPFDFDAAVTAPFRMQPGLRRLAPGSALLTATTPGHAALAAKLAVLRDRPGAALLASDDFDARPALQALMRQALSDCPGAFSCDGADALAAHRLGWRVRGTAVDGDGPAEIAAVLRALAPAQRLTALLGLALAEDFAVIDGATARIPWLAVCLPSRWAPADKLGRHFAEVHAPVADNALLLAAADGLARLVSASERWERFVWTVSADARLAQHPAHGVPARWSSTARAAELVEGAHFRSEHQTFIPVPGARQAVFTIHVESRPLRDAIDTPARARRLHAALASMSAAVLDYRGLVDARDRLLAWLAERAAATP